MKSTLISSCLIVLSLGFVTRISVASEIAAHVGPDSISVAEVEHEMQKALQDRKIEPEDKEVLQAQTLGLLINRQLVIQYLRDRKLGASEADVDAAITRITSQLKRRGLTLQNHLEQTGITEDELRRGLTWEAGWPKYLSSKLTPENIKTYFETHHREFDGTQLRVAHLLLKVPPGADEAAVQKVVEQAGELHDAIAAKKLAFADAVKMHSQAPTAADGGDIGLISRREPMPEAFSEAAFELEPGQTSEPVLTTFGVHLVHCLEIVPGKKTLQDDGVEDAVREDLIRYLFLFVSEKQRSQTKIEFTGQLPHFDPQTERLVKKK